MTSNPTDMSTHLFQTFTPVLQYLGITEFGSLLCDKIFVVNPVSLIENS